MLPIIVVQESCGRHNFNFKEANGVKWHWSSFAFIFFSICKGGIAEINNKCDLLLPGCEKQAQRQPEEKESGWRLRGLQAAWSAPLATATLLGKGRLGDLWQGGRPGAGGGWPAATGARVMYPSVAIPATFSFPTVAVPMHQEGCKALFTYSALYTQQAI